MGTPTKERMAKMRARKTENGLFVRGPELYIPPGDEEKLIKYAAKLRKSYKSLHNITE